MAVSGLGTSTATVPRPGIGPTMRTDAAFIASARSSERFTTWLTLTPGAGSNSYEVMTGPGLAWTMWPSTPKSWSFFFKMPALASSSSRVLVSWDGGGGASRPTGGSWKDLALFSPKSKVSCHASPFSTRPPLGLGGSFTTSWGGGASERVSDQAGGSGVVTASDGVADFAPE